MTSVDKQAVAHAFGRAAVHYHQHDALQRRSAAQLLTLLPKRHFPRVLDAGCGPGRYSRYWRESGSHVTALDLAADMLQQAQYQQVADDYLLADIEAIPLPDSGFDLVWSNLAVQWCSDIHLALSELYRQLKPGGVLAFTTLTAGSLPELNIAWQTLDDAHHANCFLPTEALENALSQWHYQCSHTTLSQWFPNALHAMQSLQGIGATHLHQGRSPQTLTRSKLKRLEQAWPAQNGAYPLSYHLFSGVITRD